MDPEVLKLLGVMMAVMIPVAVGGGLFVTIASFSKRFKYRRVHPSSEVIEELRARVRELERRGEEFQLLEERVEFLERMLVAAREGKQLPAS